VTRVLILTELYSALGLSISQQEIVETLDPEGSGYISYSPFLSFAALHLHHSDDADPEAEDEEVQYSYRLFTHNGTGPITIAHLRRVARELKEDVSDDVLKDMIVEANGEARRDGWKSGVAIQDFEEVLRRAGVFS
jgi:Ca2+-binding EF-hand superfamily protein